MAIKKKKKSVDLLVFVFIVAIMLTSYSSYSKYTSSLNTSTSVEVAAWNVKVNTVDITNTTNVQNNLIFHLLNQDTTKVASGKLAPSSEGYFDISIDTTSAEVAAEYTINIDLTNTADLNGITILGYEILDSYPQTATLPNVQDLETVTTSGNTATISGDILLTSNHGQVENLRIYLEWNDANTAAANTAQTNAASAVNTSISIPVSITVQQYN